MSRKAGNQARIDNWAREAAATIKANMTPEEVEVIKNNPQISIQVAGPIRNIRSSYDAITKSKIKAENAAHKILNDYYTDLIRKFL